MPAFRRLARQVSCAAVLAAGLAFGGLPAGVSLAQDTLGDVTPLGRSGANGAVCEAVRNYADPVAQRPLARAWAIRCLGWDVQIGRIYRFAAPADVAAWRADLSRRASCDATRTQSVDGLSDVTRKVCRRIDLKTPYLAYEGRRGRFTIVAEGFAEVPDVLETGLRVSSGAAPPPPVTQGQRSAAAAEIAADFGGQMAGLASAEKAAAEDAQRLLARGYLQNSEWRFDVAETDFRSLLDAAQNSNAPVQVRVQAQLNLALNISNNGRFAEADALFEAADRLIAPLGDPVLAGKALNYRAYHLRNQRRFEEAVETARRAIATRGRILTAGAANVDSAVAMAAPASTDAIDTRLADALNVRSGRSQTLSGAEIPAELRLALQDAEAFEVEGSAELSLGRGGDARSALDKARAALSRARSIGVEEAKLAARVEADLGDVELAAGHPDAAVERYEAALRTLRTRHAGSPPEGGMLLDLGRAEIAAGRAAQALDAYDRAFRIFRGVRGSLGASADAAAPYLDLLIDLVSRDPAHAADYRARYFEASESVVSDATASTISRLAARVAAGDAATAGLVRAVDDTRRELNAAESRIAALQAHNQYTAGEKAAADAELKRLTDALAAENVALLAANPGYDRLVNGAAGLAELQAALRPGETYVKTLLLGVGGYGMLVTRERAIPYHIALTRTAAREAVLRLRAPFEAADEGLAPFSVATSHTLYTVLFDPVQAEISQTRHLIYQPDGALATLPAALLVTDDASVQLMRGRRDNPATREDYTGVSWLGARIDSSLVVSAAAFLQSRAFAPSRAHRSFIGFGDPVLARDGDRAYAGLLAEGAGDLGAIADAARVRRICDSTRRALFRMDNLPDTRAELDVVSRVMAGGERTLVLGADFNDAAIRGRKDLADYRVIYFATHALLPMPDACLPEPALVTSVGPGDSDGVLDAREIVNLKLDADLVVLSACDTGGGGALSAAGTGLSGSDESLGGLTRAMIYAGARGMIVSHWSVDSAATRQLMTAMFQSGAATEAEGLQAAQRRMQGQAALSHPYFWAPFTVVGDGARAIPATDAAR